MLWYQVISSINPCILLYVHFVKQTKIYIFYCESIMQVFSPFLRGKYHDYHKNIHRLMTLSNQMGESRIYTKICLTVPGKK